MSASEIPNALFGLLSTDDALGEMLSAPDAVFPLEAPEGTSYPFVVFSQVAPGDIERTFRKKARNQLWLVAAVDRSGDPATAEAIDRRCEELLDEASFALENGLRLTGIWRVRDIPAHEIDGGELVIHAGGVYRVMWE